MRYPGPVHDSRVFRESPLSDELKARCESNLILVIVDLGNLTRIQTNFNKILSKNKIVIEHCFGLLKQKFRQLYHIKLRSLEDICPSIRACCVLHNLAINDKVLEVPTEVNGEEGAANEAVQEHQRDNIARQLPFL